MIITSNAFINSMLSPLKTLYIKIELYNSKMEYIKDITQQVGSDIGTLAINGDSPIRRSFSINLDNSKSEYLFGEDKLIWIDKRLKLYIGLQSYNQKVEYVPLGLFVLTEPVSTHSTSEMTTEINAVDKAYFLTDKRGKFINEQIIQTGTKITDAIRLIASHVGETMFNFDVVTDTLPYELTYSGTDNRWDAIKELASIAKCTIYYDVDGYLRLKKIDLNQFETEPITWEYKLGQREYAGSQRKFNDGNLYNDIVVLGGSSDTATSSYRLTVDETNPLWKDHPYSVQKIGYCTYFHNNGNPDPILLNEDDCKFRAKYELMNRLGFTEDVQMYATPNYLHDADDVISLEHLENGIEKDKFVIRSITMPLSPSIMTMSVVRYERVIENWNFI